ESLGKRVAEMHTEVVDLRHKAAATDHRIKTTVARELAAAIGPHIVAAAEPLVDRMQDQRRDLEQSIDRSVGQTLNEVQRVKNLAAGQVDTAVQMIRMTSHRYTRGV
ncbi:hypothetical protein N9M39_00285, partial [Halieaceae bacterium]|nr:hypothetical protein [Halieaceae bacterium]